MKTITLLACFCTVSILINGPALAAIEGGDSARGKALAIEKCLPCHIRGAEAGTMTPISKTQRQWERFFDKDRHNKIATGSWDQITEPELKDIMQFIYDHAADSDEPATFDQ